MMLEVPTGYSPFTIIVYGSFNLVSEPIELAFVDPNGFISVSTRAIWLKIERKSFQYLVNHVHLTLKHYFVSPRTIHLLCNIVGKVILPPDLVDITRIKIDIFRFDKRRILFIAKEIIDNYFDIGIPPVHR